jgi:hypothetical protein
LTQERYQSYDTPDTYEARIRPLLLGVVDNDAQVLGFLKSQLTGDFYTWMRIANPAGINAFFTELKNMWLERGQSLGGIPEGTSQIVNQVQALPGINPISYSLPQVAPVSQQQGISLEDMQKEIQNAFAQQKTEYQSLLEKQKNEFQVRMAQQSKKTPPPIPPKNMEQILDTYESTNPIPDTLTREEIMRVVAKAYGPPPKPQKPEKLQSSRIDRLESKIDEIGQMTSKFGRISLNDQS